MILTDEPRLFLMSELPDANKIDMDNPVRQSYQEDILLYKGMKARVLQKDAFNIECVQSRITYQFKSQNAGEWVSKINSLLDSL